MTQAERIKQVARLRKQIAKAEEEIYFLKREKANVIATAVGLLRYCTHKDAKGKRAVHTAGWSQGLCKYCGRRPPEPQKRKKREWHGCTDPRGHAFDEGVCKDCGLDLNKPFDKHQKVK